MTYNRVSGQRIQQRQKSLWSLCKSAGDKINGQNTSCMTMHEKKAKRGEVSLFNQYSVKWYLF